MAAPIVFTQPEDQWVQQPSLGGDTGTVVQDVPAISAPAGRASQLCVTPRMATRDSASELPKWSCSACAQRTPGACDLSNGKRPPPSLRRRPQLLPLPVSGELGCRPRYDDAGGDEAYGGADARALRELVQLYPHRPRGRVEVQAGGDGWAWQAVGDCERASRQGGDEPV
eukprot:scaffold18980_cov63-Phaeocystis_antarctica.AAC.2